MDNKRDYRRLGDTVKCPACGRPMDAEAYRCPNCKIYFCFKCRRRVQPTDKQYQCMNQQCKYYGKLLCNACVVEIPQMGEQTKSIPKKTFSGAKLVGVFGVVVVISFGILLILGQPLWGAGVGSLVIAAIVSGWLSNFTIQEKVTETVEIGRRKSCIACKQAVEHLKYGS